MIWWIAIACFTTAAALDYALVRHQQAVLARTPLRAGAWSVACYLAGLVGIAAVVEASPWYALPSAAGYFLGSALAVGAR